MIQLNKNELNKFLEIVKFQKKDPNIILNNFIRNYNIKYKDDYDSSINDFWNNMVDEFKNKK